LALLRQFNSPAGADGSVLRHHTPFERVIKICDGASSPAVRKGSRPVALREERALANARANAPSHQDSQRGTSPTVREGSVIESIAPSDSSVEREFMILTKQHVLDCLFHVPFFPQIDRTSMPRPWLNASGQ